jgi:hypothetical protein
MTLGRGTGPVTGPTYAVAGITPEFLGTIQFARHTRGMNPTSPELSQLHDRYVEAINIAVGDDNEALVAQLAAEYDDEALDLIRRSAA